MLLLFAGLFAVASVLFSFVSWDVDQSILQKPAEERELLGNEVENLCGRDGGSAGGVCWWTIRSGCSAY